MKPPHPRCNFLDNECRLVMGGMPDARSLQNLIDYGITLFVNLVQNVWYFKSLPPNVSHIHFPIGEGGIPNKFSTEKLINDIIEEYHKGAKIYIHCMGGHGRAGTISAILIGKMYNWDTATTVAYLERRRLERTDISLHFVPIPETTPQIQFIHSFLGGAVIPDRSDQSWRKRVRNYHPPPEKPTTKPIECTSETFLIDRFPELQTTWKLEIPIMVNGISFPTVENALCYFKFNYPSANIVSIDFSEKIRKIPPEFIPKQTPPIRPDWDLVKRDLMYVSNLSKFKMNSKCREILLSTSNTKLQSGINPELAEILILVRAQLQN